MFETRRLNITQLVKLELPASVENIFKVHPFKNHQYIAEDNSENLWVEKSTEKLFEWRQIFGSTYARWSMSVFALTEAKNKFLQSNFKDHTLEVFSIRNSPNKLVDESIQKVRRIPILEWNIENASKNFDSTINYICAYGMIDLYSTLEEFVFTIYKTLLFYKPEILLKNKDYKMFRKLYENQKKDIKFRDQWNKEWSIVLDKWQVKKLYSGLNKVFQAYCNELNILSQRDTKHDVDEQWSDVINQFSMLRNHLIHGATEVDDKLGGYHDTRPWLIMKCNKGDKLFISEDDLEFFEYELNSLFDFINFKLICIIFPPLT